MGADFGTPATHDVAVLLGATIRRRISKWEIHAGGLVFEAPGSARVTQPQPPFPTGSHFIATGPVNFYAAGNGVTVTFTDNTPGPTASPDWPPWKKAFLWIDDGFPVVGGRDDTATPSLVLRGST